MHGRDKRMKGFKHRARLFNFGRCESCSSSAADRDEGCGVCGEELPNVFMVAMETKENFQSYSRNWWDVDPENIPVCPNQNGGGNSMRADQRAAGALRGYTRCSGPVSLRTAQRARELANFSLALRGDTLGSDRWINAMAAGSIPVHVGTVQELGWLPFQSVVPWEKFIVTIPEDEFMADPFKTLKARLIEMPATELQKRRKLMRHHVKDVDWGVYHSRTFENFLAETLLIPASRCLALGNESSA